MKDLAEGKSQRAMLAAGKEMAKRAYDDLTSSPEERAKRDEARRLGRNKALVKYGVIGIVGIVSVLALMSVLASLWMYALGFMVVVGFGAGAYFYAKPKVLALKASAAARLAAKNVKKETADKEQAARDAVTAKQQKLEDELAALKRKSLP